MIDSLSELSRLRSLDSQAVSSIYDHYFPEVFRYARYRLGDELLAEDIASEVFVRLLEAVKAKRGPHSNLRGWLIGTAHHMVTDHIRGRYRHPVEAISDSLPGDGLEPGEQASKDNDGQVVRLALAQLTDDQQHVLALRFGQGYSLEETAGLMNKNVNAVKALQFRALNALQKKIGRAE
jgi:RNA polymerase sigma-70 factor (ECF subfamily)